MSATTRLVNRITDAQVNAGMSQRALAAAVGVDPSTVNRWLKGNQLPDLKHLPALAKALGLDYSKLLELRAEASDEDAKQARGDVKALMEDNRMLADDVRQLNNAVNQLLDQIRSERAV